MDLDGDDVAQPRASQAEQATASPLPDPSILRIRAVHRAVADLRRGTPVLLLGQPDFVVLAADTAGAAGLAELSEIAAGPPVLLLSPVRAAALLRRPVEPGIAIALRTAGLLDAPVLRGMADPTASQLLAEPPEPASLPAPAPAALALVKLGRLLPAALVAPVRPDAAAHAARLGLLAVRAADVLAHPDSMAAGLVQVASAHVPLAASADARVVAFRAPDAGIEHLAILIGKPEHAVSDGPAPLVRVHSECFTGDLLGSLRCDCGPQLHAALDRMAADGSGVLLYLAQEGRGIGLTSKLRAYALQDRGLDTLDANRALGWNADERNFLVAATMLDQLGIGRVRLLTNNPDKLTALAACGVQVEGREPLVIEPNGINDHYLATKARRFGHLLG
jgi:GTP cyclohydrolase II